MPRPPTVPQIRSTAIQRHRIHRGRAVPSQPRPSNTNGNAVPSLRPPSPVSRSADVSRSCALRSCTSEASTGSVGASTAPSTSARPAGRSPGQPVAAGGDSGDGHHHRDGGQPQRQAPAPVADRYAHLDAHGEQRDQQRDLGDGLEQRELAQRMQLEHVECRRPEREADQQVDHRRAHGQAIEESPEQRDHYQQHADEQEPECGHRRTMSYRRRMRPLGRPQRRVASAQSGSAGVVPDRRPRKCLFVVRFGRGVSQTAVARLVDCRRAPAIA